MVLVDTSILIGYLKGEDRPPFNELDRIIENRIPFGINSLIYQEVLQGCRSERESDEVKEYLGSLRFYELRNGKESYERAAHLYNRCRKAGVDVRSTVDLLIAQTAIENDLYILENDKDYRAIAQVSRKLKIYK